MKKILLITFIIVIVILIAGFNLVKTFFSRSSVSTANETNQETEVQLKPSILPDFSSPLVMSSPAQDSVALNEIVITNVPGPDVVTFQHQVSFIPQDQIYITVKLPINRLGTTLSAEMKHSASKSTLGPVKASIKPLLSSKNTAYAMFELTPPPPGWPVGEYVISIADPSDNLLKQVAITVK